MVQLVSSQAATCTELYINRGYVVLCPIGGEKVRCQIKLDTKTRCRIDSSWAMIGEYIADTTDISMVQT
jgi:hypothetical protein